VLSVLPKLPVLPPKLPVLPPKLPVLAVEAAGACRRSGR